MKNLEKNHLIKYLHLHDHKIAAHVVTELLKCIGEFDNLID